MTGVDGALDDRPRTAPIDSGAFTESLLLRDFVFTSATSVGQGIDLRIQGLTADRAYLVELWSFDSGSQPLRTSDWTVNGAFLWDDYAFNGSNTPATNDDYKMVGLFTASATGELLISGRVAGTAPAVFLNAIRISETAPATAVDLGHPIISEFLADNDNGITDEDGDESDWIEIWNTTTSTLDLTGWRLTDNAGLAGKWIFPTGVIVPAQARLVVWASGKDRKTNPAQLHTNFALSQTLGGYLALSRPDGTIVSVFSGYPTQRSDISYGFVGTTEPLTAGFFQTPTPGGANGLQVPGFVEDTVFSVNRGFFSAPFTVHITCATPGAAIYYTANGSEPTTSSTPYPGAAGIPISATTVLRAKAFSSPLAPTNTDTQTYIFNAKAEQARPAESRAGLKTCLKPSLS